MFLLIGTTDRTVDQASPAATCGEALLLLVALLLLATSGRSESCFLRAPGRTPTDLMNAAPFSLLVDSSLMTPLGTCKCHLTSMPCERSVCTSMLCQLSSCRHRPRCHTSQPLWDGAAASRRAQILLATAPLACDPSACMCHRLWLRVRRRKESDFADARDWSLGRANRDRLCTYSTGHL